MPREKPRSDFKNLDIEREEMRKNYLEKFIKFVAYSDDLPLEKLEPDNPNYHGYKCRNNFWAAISGRIQKLLGEKLIATPDAIQMCGKFVDYCSENAGKTRPTTEDEIKYINKIINLVIEQLEKPENKKED